MPSGFCKKLDRALLKPSESNAYPERTLAEFLKTAEAFAQPPWELLKAQHWLEELCRRNKDRIVQPPPELYFVFHPDLEFMAALQLEDKEVEVAEPPAAPPQPREIRVVRPTKKAKMKRPAAAEPPPRQALEGVPLLRLP